MLSSTLTQGTTWERIANLIELENSQSKTIARTGPGESDCSRLSIYGDVNKSPLSLVVYVVLETKLTIVLFV